MPKRIEFEGKVHEFPDDFSDQEIQKALSSAPSSIPTPREPIDYSSIPKERSWTDSVGKFVSGAASQLNPMEAVRGINQAFYHPIETGKALLNAQGKLGRQSFEALKRGDLLTGARKGAEYLLPGVGPNLSSMGDKAASGEVAEALGEATGFGLLGALGPKVPKAAGRVAQGTKAFFQTQIEPTILKALNPKPSDPSGFLSRLPKTLANIKASSPVEIVNDATLIKAAENAIERHQAILNEWLEQGTKMGARIPGDPVIKATQEALPLATNLEYPGEAQAILSRTQQAYKRDFSIPEMRQLLKEKNAELDAFFKRDEGKQSAAVLSGTPQAVVKAQRDAIADALYKAVDPESAGANPRQIQLHTGDITDILDAARQRRITIAREKPTSKFAGTARAALDVASIPVRYLTGSPGTATYAAGRLGEPSISPMRALHGESDPLIAKVFKAVGEAAPIPRPPATQIRGLLGPAPIQAPPTADPSSVRGVPARNWYPYPTKPMPQLEAPPTRVPPIPDESSVRGIQADRPHFVSEHPAPPTRALLPPVPEPSTPPFQSWEGPAKRVQAERARAVQEAQGRAALRETVEGEVPPTFQEIQRDPNRTLIAPPPPPSGRMQPPNFPIPLKKLLKDWGYWGE